MINKRSESIGRSRLEQFQRSSSPSRSKRAHDQDDTSSRLSAGTGRSGNDNKNRSAIINVLYAEAHKIKLKTEKFRQEMEIKEKNNSPFHPTLFKAPKSVVPRRRARSVTSAPPTTSLSGASITGTGVGSMTGGGSAAVSGRVGVRGRRQSETSADTRSERMRSHSADARSTRSNPTTAALRQPGVRRQSGVDLNATDVSALTNNTIGASPKPEVPFWRAQERLRSRSASRAERGRDGSTHTHDAPLRQHSKGNFSTTQYDDSRPSTPSIPKPKHSLLPPPELPVDAIKTNDYMSLSPVTGSIEEIETETKMLKYFLQHMKKTQFATSPERPLSPSRRGHNYDRSSTALISTKADDDLIHSIDSQIVAKQSSKRSLQGSIRSASYDGGGVDRLSSHDDNDAASSVASHRTLMDIATEDIPYPPSLPPTTFVRGGSYPSSFPATGGVVGDISSPRTPSSKPNNGSVYGPRPPITPGSTAANTGLPPQTPIAYQASKIRTTASDDSSMGYSGSSLGTGSHRKITVGGVDLDRNTVLLGETHNYDHEQSSCDDDDDSTDYFDYAPTLNLVVLEKEEVLINPLSEPDKKAGQGVLVTSQGDEAVEVFYVTGGLEAK